MKIVNILITLLFGLCAIPTSAITPDLNGEYAKCTFVDSTKYSMPYRLLSPTNTSATEKYPLVLFLHGAAERGSDNESQLANGASIFTNPVNAEKYKAFVVFPQCKERTWTGNIEAKMFMPGGQTPEETKEEQVVINLVNDLISKYPIDTDRIYIIGVSMGAIATYDLVCRFPELFAAAVPICGAVNPDRLPATKQVKFLIFHGDADEVIPPICSREAYKTLEKAGATVDYIELTGVGHECWPYAFNIPTFLPWLFGQRKNPQPSETLAEGPNF